MYRGSSHCSGPSRNGWIQETSWYHSGFISPAHLCIGFKLSWALPQWEGWQLAALTHYSPPFATSAARGIPSCSTHIADPEENVTEPVWAGQQDMEASHFQSGLLDGLSHLRNRWLCVKNDMNIWWVEKQGRSCSTQRLGIVEKIG